MTEITQKTIFKLDLWIIMGIVTVIAVAVTGWWNIVDDVNVNTDKIIKTNLKLVALKAEQDEHIKNFQETKQYWIITSEKTKANEKILIEIKDDIKWLVREKKAEEK